MSQTLKKRAVKILEEAETLGLRKFLAPHEIVSGNSRLNFAFIANLFNNAKHVKAKPVTQSVVINNTNEKDLLALIEKLQKENEHLREENETLRGENKKLKSAQSDAEKLKERLRELEKNLG